MLNIRELSLKLRQNYFGRTNLSKYSKLIFQTAYQYLFDFGAAEDVVQDVFVKLFIKKKVFNSPEHEKAWLLRVTINQCKNYLSSASSKVLSLNDENIGDLRRFENESEQYIDIQRELEKLTGQQRVCVYLYYFEDYKVREISEMLKMKENTVKSVLSRARQTLKNNLDEEDDYELQ